MNESLLKVLRFCEREYKIIKKHKIFNLLEPTIKDIIKNKVI